MRVGILVPLDESFEDKISIVKKLGFSSGQVSPIKISHEIFNYHQFVIIYYNVNKSN